MRPIKFRAWDKVKREMLYDPNSWACIHLSDMFNNPVSNWVWMQFTGIKDKNGTKIYEGDIIEYGTGLTTQKAIIEFQVHCYNAGFYPSESANASHYWEVIGNIHENPELMEGKEDE